MDLPDRAVLVAGLEHWVGRTSGISEPRLLGNLRHRMNLPSLELRSPPIPDREDQPDAGVVAWQFPEWFVAQYESPRKEFGRSRPLLHQGNLIKGRYVDNDTTSKRKRKDWPVVPIRFVQGCPNGHISDIIMLHSLAHLLLTAIALECGYSAVSLRERIYLRDTDYGILIYTGAPDAEGTLGGLAQVGRRLKRHLEGALELGRLCSNDPVCAQHRPNRPLESRPLHGAACHGCLLIAEPSCERRNELLDRSLVVPTVDVDDVAFFRG